MHSYPASELRISEVERGQSCAAILPMPPGKTPSAGECILFALAHTQAGRETHHVKNGDSVLSCAPMSPTWARPNPRPARPSVDSLGNRSVETDHPRPLPSVS